jgi:hypothetical protein
MTLRLGKERPVFDSRTLQLGRYLTAALEPPPAAVDYGTAVPNWPMYFNDQYGDCTCAAAAHMVQNWTANGKGEVTPDPQAVLRFYEHFTSPGPENGCSMLAVLKYWRSKGLGGDTIAAFTSVELTNQVQASDAVNLFGGLYIGVALPDFAVQGDVLTVPWAVPPSGPVGPAAPNPQNGHCIPAVGYDARNLYVVTWGTMKSMSWPFYCAYADEAYAVLSQDFLDGKGQTPTGLDLAQLNADLTTLESVPSHVAGFSRAH